jgi:hypothetical protein
MTNKEELDKSLGRLNQAGVVHVALELVNEQIDDNEKEWKELDKLSVGFNTPTKKIYQLHKIGLVKIKNVLEYYERRVA